jgi:Protein of unknown function (DUF2510)
MEVQAQPAGWYADPQASASWRYWDGRAWTQQTAPAQERDWPPMRQAAGRTLLLHQENFAGVDELKLEDQVYAQIQKPFAGDLKGHCADGSWLFDRKGIIVGRVEVCALPVGTLVANYEWDNATKTRGGTLRFPDGRVFRWERTDQLKATYHVGFRAYFVSDGGWSWFGPGGTAVTSGMLGSLGETVSYATGRTAADISVVVYDSAAAVPELPLLVLLSSYLVWEWTIQRQRVST